MTIHPRVKLKEVTFDKLWLNPNICFSIIALKRVDSHLIMELTSTLLQMLKCISMRATASVHSSMK